MAKTKTSKSVDDPEVIKAIEYADKWAGEDDETFIEALNASYRSAADTRMRKARQLRTIERRAAG